MNSLLHWLTSPEWAQVVKALLHSLWQGALIVLSLALLLRRIANPETRYRLMLSALAALVLTSVATWGLLTAPKAPAPTIPPPSLQYSITPPAPSGPVDKFIVPANWTQAKPQVQWTAWLALAWLLGTAAMLGRASVKVAGAEQLRRACQPLNDPRITELLAEARRAVNLTRRVRVAVTNQLTSPAVVGVLVPTLILPLSLITTLSPEQLRFVLLHELAHIRRGDYLANLFQLFAEALFFFNPAVWWLSHHIRREREACCDALAIELSGAPADYARTLVSVAETILNPPPTAAPAFGNDREPSSLADRVQRVLVPGYRPSLRLTWRAMLAAMAVGVFMLAVVAIGTRETVAATAALVGADNEPVPAAVSTNSAMQTNVARAQLDVLRPIADTVLRTNPPIEWIRPLPDADTNEAPLYARTFKVTSNDLAHVSGISGPHPWTGRQPRRSLSYSKEEGTLSVIGTLKDLDAIGAMLEPVNALAPAPVDPRREIVERLERVRLDNVSFDAAPLTEVVRFLADECRKRDPDKRGINFFVAPRADQTAIGPFGPVTNTSIPVDMSSVVIKTYSPLMDVKLANLLDVVVKSADKPIQYSVTDYGIVFSPRDTNNIPLYTRTFKVTSNDLARALGNIDLSQIQQKVREFVAGDGVDLKSPGKAVFYNYRQGTLFVRATLEDLDKIEHMVSAWQTPSHISTGTTNSPGNTTNLLTRTFKVDPNTLLPGLASAGGSGTTNLTERLRNFFTSVGVDLQPPKSMFLNERQGGLFVRALPADLDVIEQALQVLNQVIPQVNIRAKFVEVTGGGSGDQLSLFLGSVATQPMSGTAARKSTNSVGPSGTNSSTFTGILTPAQFKVVLNALEQREGAEILSTPDVTTISGRQAQLQVVDMRTIVSGLSTVTATNGTSTNVFQTSTLPFGPVLDVIPHVSADGFTVNLTLIPTVTEFIGYQKPDPVLAKFARQKGADGELPLPIYRERQAATSATVWDGQTIVLGGFTSEIVTRQSDGSKTKKPDPKAQRKHLFVFITPTVIDPAGNRVHTDEEMPSRTNPVLKQPGK